MNFRQILNLVAVVAVITVNGLANALPINGQDTGQIADAIPTLFTPAGYVFSIWGVIYLGLIAFAVYQALPAQRADARLKAVFPWFQAAALFNMAWIFAWHYNQVPLSMVLMLGLLGSLIAIYLRLGIGQRPFALRERWAVQVPFSIYLGWISVATIANAAALLFVWQWDGFGLSPAIWSAVVLAVGTLLGLAMMALRREVAYVLVLVWAFIGIVVKFNAAQPVVAWAAGVGVAVLLIGMVVLGLRRAALK